MHLVISAILLFALVLAGITLKKIDVKIEIFFFLLSIICLLQILLRAVVTLVWMVPPVLSFQMTLIHVCVHLATTAWCVRTVNIKYFITISSNNNENILLKGPNCWCAWLCLCYCVTLQMPVFVFMTWRMIQGKILLYSPFLS